VSQRRGRGRPPLDERIAFFREHEVVAEYQRARREDGLSHRDAMRRASARVEANWPAMKVGEYQRAEYQRARREDGLSHKDAMRRASEVVKAIKANWPAMNVGEDTVRAILRREHGTKAEAVLTSTVTHTVDAFGQRWRTITASVGHRPIYPNLRRAPTVGTATASMRKRTNPKKN
jgi:hypothetical protein